MWETEEQVKNERYMEIRALLEQIPGELNSQFLLVKPDDEFK